MHTGGGLEDRLSPWAKRVTREKEVPIYDQIFWDPPQVWYYLQFVVSYENSKPVHGRYSFTSRIYLFEAHRSMSVFAFVDVQCIKRSCNVEDKYECGSYIPEVFLSLPGEAV